VGRDLTSALLGMSPEVRVLDTRTEGFPLPGQKNLELITGKVEDPSHTCSFLRLWG